MRLLFFLVLIANFVVFAYGTGAFGPSPQEAGREPLRATQQIRADTLIARPIAPVSSAPARS